MRAHTSAKPAVRCGKGERRSQGSRRPVPTNGGKSRRRLLRRGVQRAASVQAGCCRAAAGAADAAGSAGAVARAGACKLTNGSLQTHEAGGAPHPLPPARDTGSRGEPIIGPAQFSLGVRKAVRDPGAPPERVADRRRELPREGGHELPGGRGGQVGRIGGDRERPPEGAASAKDGLPQGALRAAPIGADPLARPPGWGADPLAGLHPDARGGGPRADRHHTTRRPRWDSALIHVAWSPETVSARTTSQRNPNARSCWSRASASSGVVGTRSPGVRPVGGL
jgi:hypothetical protein